MRSFEISCTIIIQAISQLKTRYKDNWETIMGNCDSLVFLGGQEEATLKYISERLGKETIVTQTDSRNFGSKGGGSSRSKQIVGRELMTPTEVAEMPTDECIVFIRGIKPFRDKKYDYPKHPNYPFCGDADPKFMYDVQKEIFTGKVIKPESRLNKEKKRLRILAEKAETLNAEKMDRLHMEMRNRSRTHSQKGQELNNIDTLENTVNSLAEKYNSSELAEGKVPAVSIVDGFVPEGLDEFADPNNV